MFSVSSCELSILWNGESLKPFTPTRGLRQGDPLSPYLFILAMEKLASFIQSSINKKLWKPLSISRNGFSVSHLYFADDLMLFAGANTRQIREVLRCLDDFSKVSGLSINYDKSKVFFSPNLGVERVRSRSNLCGIPSTCNLGTYLGIPLRHGKVSRNHYAYILDRMKSKLATWKANSLSLAGRVVLIKSVMASIPVYSMQCQWLPTHVCSEIDKINRNFLWGSSDESRKPHLLNWNIVTLPKEYGGLDIRTARENNLAMMSKLGWSLLKRDQASWCKAIASKYLKKSSLWDVKTRSQSSSTWKGILKTRSLIQNGITWNIGDGEHTKFWFDPWVHGHSVAQLAPDLHIQPQEHQ